MRTQLNISIAAVSLLMTAGITAPACLADSEASFQASSYSESNNNSEQARENTSSASTGSASTSHRENDSNSSWQARGPASTSVINSKEPSFNFPVAGKTWGSGAAWGVAPVSQPQTQVSAKAESTAKPALAAGPQVQVVNYHPINAQLAARPIYSSSSHTVIRRGTRSNSRYSYIKKQIRQAETSM
ncbi:MAG TPA: hypothetical protein V6C69_05740 [Trichormus sp.]|jgi:hypothetical protein